LTNCLRADGCPWFNYTFLTLKERDNETGLDYFGARYYSSTSGRFTTADPLYFTGSRLWDPQQFNLYSYVRNNPLMFIDPDGRDFTGSSGSAGATLTDDDRRRLEAQLKSLAPGTSVDAQGNVHKGSLFHRILNHLTGHGGGQALVTSLVNSNQTTNIVVTRGTNNSRTDWANDANARSGQPTDAIVYWDPQQTSNPGDVMVRTTNAANGGITSETSSDPAIVLGHELIHASHVVNGTLSFDRMATHDLVATAGTTTETYREGPAAFSREEFRTVGFAPYAQRGAITENRLRGELGVHARAGYYPSNTWTCTSCGP
jgi:RHS repeat-associated protein